MKTLCKVLCTVLGVCLVCSGFVACSTDSVANADELTYVGVRINPEIELVVDKDGEVVAANAVNADGETVLCELTLVGLSAEEACEAVTETATELGFIDVDAEEANVYVFVDGKDKQFASDLNDRISEKVNGYFDKNGIFGKVSPEDFEAYEALAEEWNVTPKQARIISRITELYPEMTIEEILELSPGEMLELIRDDKDRNGLTADIRDEYREAVDLLKEKYAPMFDQIRETLKELETKLEDASLGEEEIEALRAEYETAKAEFEALKEQFREELETLKTEKRERADELREQFAEKARELREFHHEKILEHVNKFNDAREETENKIREWREQANNFFPDNFPQ
ncbi:MAG: coiled-coil domain-containing protein [Christensenellales bacterium]